MHAMSQKTGHLLYTTACMYFDQGDSVPVVDTLTIAQRHPKGPHLLCLGFTSSSSLLDVTLHEHDSNTSEADTCCRAFLSV